MSYQVRVRIRGTSPLLHNRMALPDEAAEEPRALGGAQDYSGEWKQRMYRDELLGCYIPADHIYGLLPKAGADFQIKGRGKKTYRDLLKAIVLVDEERIAIDRDAPDEIDRRYVAVNRNRVLRSRPRYAPGWEACFTLTVLDDQFRAELLEEILRHGGQRVGIGDYRPRFGRFAVTQFEVLEKDQPGRLEVAANPAKAPGSMRDRDPDEKKKGRRVTRTPEGAESVPG